MCTGESSALSSFCLFCSPVLCFLRCGVCVYGENVCNAAEADDTFEYAETDINESQADTCWVQSMHIEQSNTGKLYPRNTDVETANLPDRHSKETVPVWKWPPKDLGYYLGFLKPLCKVGCFRHCCLLSQSTVTINFSYLAVTIAFKSALSQTSICHMNALFIHSTKS